jgi:hypothetical protein
MDCNRLSSGFDRCSGRGCEGAKEKKVKGFGVVLERGIVVEVVFDCFTSRGPLCNNVGMGLARGRGYSLLLGRLGLFSALALFDVSLYYLAGKLEKLSQIAKNPKFVKQNLWDSQ